MVPRPDIVFLDVRLPAETNLQRIIESDHSHFPVCDGGLRNVLGIINVKQLLPGALRGAVLDFTAHLQPCLYVPETLTAMELLERLRVSHAHIACAVNEYGGIEGIVTLRDLVEAVTGTFISRNADDAWALQREDGSWLLDGIIPLPELKDSLGLKELPDEEKGHYHTLSGLFMLLLGRIPSTRDSIDWEGWRFEVVDMDGRRIDKVLAMRLPPSISS
jgi:putative hemolysin